LTSKEVVKAGVSRTLAGIFDTKFVPWKLHKPGSDFEPDLSQGQTWIKKLEIVQTGKDEPSAFKPLAGEVDESYNLTVSTEGDVKLTAVSSIGVLRGLETFSQLFYHHSSGKAWYTPFAPVSVQDAPKFPHRGVMMDTARHFFPVPDILRTIDAMSWNKLNRLHVHVTDSQSWPLEIPSMPEVSAKGAYHPSQTYSPADIDHIQKYGAARGVEVYFEIDMPGHIGVVALSHPELIVAYNELPYHWWCAQPPCGAFKLNNTAVDAFLEKLFDDLLPRLAPYAAYFHTGGDELNRNDSMLDEGIRSNSSEVLQPLLQKFIDEQHARVRKHGMTPVVWEEIPLEWNVTMPTDTVVQSWLGGDSVKKLTGKGFKVIDSNYNFWVGSTSPPLSPLSSHHNTQTNTHSPSTSTAAAANGSTGTTARPSPKATPSSTGATRPRTGGSCTRTTRRRTSPRRRPRACSAARSPSGARPSTPTTSTPSSGRAPAPPARCCGPGAWTGRRGRIGASWRRRQG
jgi:hexosaminidase